MAKGKGWIATNMGFFKEVSLLTKTEQKKILAIALPKKPIWEACDKCGSEHIDHFKLVGWGEKAGTVYHYKVKCLDCGRRYFVERNRYVFEKVKDKEWIKSKSYKRFEMMQKIGAIV